MTYTTAPLEKDTEITGLMTATLWAVTEGKDTDWNVMFQHVYPDGRAERIQDGVMRARFRDGFAQSFDRPSLLKPGRAYKYDIDLWFTSRVIPAGHRLRVTVASAAFPKYDRNLTPAAITNATPATSWSVSGLCTIEHIHHSCACRSFLGEQCSAR